LSLGLEACSQDAKKGVGVDMQNGTGKGAEG
jgi:hypothetical protein